MKIMVSACLTGEKCKYNGGSNLNELLLSFLAGHTVLAFCPETLGGLPTPRVPAEIRNGKVMARDGICVDDAFRRGAEKAICLAREFQPDIIVLQSRSPSCGAGQIYDGSFSGKLISGNGVFAETALREGFRIIDIGCFLKTYLL